MLHRGCKSLSAHQFTRYNSARRGSQRTQLPAKQCSARCDTVDVLHLIWGYGRVRKASALQADYEGAIPSISTNFPPVLRKWAGFKPERC